MVSCKKSTEIQVDKISTWQLSKDNVLEKPLVSISTLNKNRIASSLLSATIYGCGSNISGNYSGDGYYMYPFYTLNFDTSPQDTKVNTTVYSADVPNRFNIYDSLGSLVAYTQWMGNVTYPGPWGTSLNTPQTQTISFTTKTKGPYSLKVETVTQEYSDSWTASLSCTIDTSYKNSANPYDNAGALHNLLLDYFKTNTTLPLSNGSKIIYTFDKYFKIYGSASVASKSVLPATQLSFAHQFENSSDHYTFLVQGNYMSQAGVNYYKKLDSVIDANSIMSSLYSSIKSIECQILASSLIQKEKNTLREAASIGRYSSYYWSIPSNQSKWNINTSITGKFSWGSLGKADLKGGIEGGVAGAIIGGVVATPIGSVPSWIAGAVSWGAGCSVSNAIGQVSGCW